MKKSIEEMLEPYKPKHPFDVLFDGIEASREFRRTRADATKFKPIPIADCHLARNCGNCRYNKGRIDELPEFVEYGLLFYYGFYACTYEGRTCDKCKLTTNDSVCRNHQFVEVENGGYKLSTRDKTCPLRHIERCIKARLAKAANMKRVGMIDEKDGEE